MDSQRIENLAKKYNTKDFIARDPVGFAHRYKEKRDIEIAAFWAQWLAYGRRENFLSVLDNLAKEIVSPYSYIANKDFEGFKGKDDCLYRFYKQGDFYDLCEALYKIYFDCEKSYPDMESALSDIVAQRRCLVKVPKEARVAGYERFCTVLTAIQSCFSDVKGVPVGLNSACKRLCMFLRWMVRRDNIVDFGLWNILEPCELIVPVDVHVFRQSKELGLTNRKSADFKTAIEISSKLREIFPSDPLLGDFALFGYGVNDR